MSSASSLCTTVAQAVVYLTRPLAAHCTPSTLSRLRVSLESNLTAVYEPSWVVSEPLRGSGRRCMTLSPDCTPPRAIYNACLASRIQWSDWIRLLGGVEFDMFVDPGCISIRVRHPQSGLPSKLVTVWSEELEIVARARAVEAYKKQFESQAQKAKTVAQILIEGDDEEEEELFTMIADEIRAPTWMTPVVDRFPSIPTLTPPRPGHSRSSSRSSNISSTFSFDSVDSADSFGSMTSSSSASSIPRSHKSSSSISLSNSLTPPTFKLSRRERARQAKVFVDTTKTEVTPYDGGKTTVLTGGVMLGGPVKSKKALSL